MMHRRYLLESAVDYFQLPKEAGFHRAVNDAAYTADVFRRIDQEEAKRGVLDLIIIRIRRVKGMRSMLRYDSYYKYISRVFDTREEALADREVRSTKCYKCGRAARKKMHRFSARTKAYYCLADCPEHGYIRGKLRIRERSMSSISILSRHCG